MDWSVLHQYCYYYGIIGTVVKGMTGRICDMTNRNTDMRGVGGQSSGET